MVAFGGKSQQLVLKAVVSGSSTQKQLAAATKLSLRTVKTVLAQLVELQLIAECQNPNDLRCKTYEVEE